jgi:hypothetical protein
VANRLFSSVDEKDGQLIINGWLTTSMGILATSVGQPWLMLAAPALQVFIRRSFEMWMGDEHRPVRGFSTDERDMAVTYRPGRGVEVDGRPLFRRRTLRTQEIAGRLRTTGRGPHAPRRGDPVALVVNDSSWTTRNDGLVIPARLGDAFRIQVPRGTYNVSAYSVDKEWEPKVDPVTAIGARYLPPGSSMGQLALQPRTWALTRRALAELRSAVPLEGGRPCRNCGKTLYLDVPFCFYCGHATRGDRSGRPGRQGPDTSPAVRKQTRVRPRPSAAGSTAKKTRVKPLPSAAGSSAKQTRVKPLRSTGGSTAKQTRVKPLRSTAGSTAKQTRVKPLRSAAGSTAKASAASRRLQQVLDQYTTRCPKCGSPNWAGLQRCISCQATVRRLS